MTIKVSSMELKNSLLSFRGILQDILILWFIFMFTHVSWATAPEVQTEEPAAVKDQRAMEEKYGVLIKGVRLTAADHMIDFRYRIIDSEKASMLADRQTKPYLIDQATGTKLPVPRTRLGPMRQTAVKPAADRDYIILFGNPNKLVKQGSRVTVVIGDFKVENLIVE